MAQQAQGMGSSPTPQALTGQQKRGLRKATAAGTQDQYLQKHQGVAAHLEKGRAATGMPGGGAGGQKAAGQAAPPSQKIRDLTGQQTKQLAKAEGAGRVDQYLKNHPGVAAHQQKVAAAAAPTGAPTGAPAQGAGGNKANAANAATAPPTPGAAAPATPIQGGTAGGSPTPGPATTNDIINKQYGAGASDKFQQDWYGGNPLQTAMDAAKRATGESLAGVRNRYGQSGFGMSGREGLAEGQAVADVNTKLGEHLADLGTQVRGDDLNRLANMFATSGAQDLQAQQLGLEANQQLINAGTGMTGIGASEQAIPNMDAVMNLLANMSSQPTQSSGAQRQPRK